jgi:hypothetical protein
MTMASSIRTIKQKFFDRSFLYLSLMQDTQHSNSFLMPLDPIFPLFRERGTKPCSIHMKWRFLPSSLEFSWAHW